MTIDPEKDIKQKKRKPITRVNHLNGLHVEWLVVVNSPLITTAILGIIIVMNMACYQDKTIIICLECDESRERPKQIL